jgi:copper chaperone CopZ
MSGEERSAKKVFETLTFKISGMHCDGCAWTIQALLSAEPGVQTATVSFKDSEARVRYDRLAIDENRLAAAIEQPGYRVIGRHA